MQVAGFWWGDVSKLWAFEWLDIWKRNLFLIHTVAGEL